MKKLIFVFMILVQSLFLSSCEELDGGYTGADKGAKTYLVGGVFAVEVDENSVRYEGTASNGGDSGHNFKLQFFLPEGEELKFVFFASKELKEGIEVVFSKESGKVFFDLKINDRNHGQELVGLFNDDLIKVEIDIHNDHGDTHVILWDLDGPFGSSGDCMTATEDKDKCLYNTADSLLEFDYWSGSKRAKGTFWGLIGDKSLIEKVEGPLLQRADV